MWFLVCFLLNGNEWICALLIFGGGIIKEIRDKRKTFFSILDVGANTVGILAMWGWIRLMLTIKEGL